MYASTVWKTVIRDRSNFLDSLIALLSDHQVRYCVIGDQGVNAYAAPLISLDLDLVVAVDQLELVEMLLGGRFHIERFAKSLEVSATDSDLRVQIQTDPRYFQFPERASVREVLGISLSVAALEDILQGKIWAVTDPQGRPSKRRKDLLDIERLREAYPNLRQQIPAEILDRLAQI